MGVNVHKLDNSILSLNSLHCGDSFSITGIAADCPLNIRRSLYNLGLIKGKMVSVWMIGPFNGLIALNIHNSLVAIRRENAKYITGFRV